MTNPGSVCERQLPTAPTDLVGLFNATALGDRRALAALVAMHTPMMRRVARQILRSSADVDDAVQDAWMSFTIAVTDIVDPAAVAGWLATTTRRAALNIGRRLSRLPPPDLVERDLGDPTETTLDSMRIAVERQAVRAAVSTLDVAEAELIWMVVSGVPYSEISRLTGRAVGGIGPTRQRILSKLRRNRDIARLRAA